MSVTFTAELGTIIAHVITCGCRDTISQVPRFGAYEDAADALLALSARINAGDIRRQPLPGCALPGICPEYPLSVYPVEDLERPEVDVSRSNAVPLLHALGYGELPEHEQLAGQASAEEFRGRVLTALALAPIDEGLPAEQNGRYFEGGRRRGYLQARLLRLHELADWCADHRRSVHWH